MSLFGDESAPSSRAKSSLFDEEQAGSKASSSMFGDDTGAADTGSPWEFTPKKQSRRGNLVRSLLADADVPDFYIDAFDARQQNGTITLDSEGNELLSSLSASDRRKIWDIVTGRGENRTLNRNEFNVLLALIGLAQEGEELSLDAVDERRRKLPVPSLPAPQQKQAPKPPATPQAQSQPGAQTSPQKTQTGTRKPSFGAGFGESDPWASPAMHKGHNHTNGIGAGAGAGMGQRTTSSITTSAAEPNDSTGGSVYAGQANGGQEGTSWGGTSSFEAPSGSGFADSGASGDGFGDEGNPSGTVRRPQVPRHATSKGAEEEVTVNMLEEKEGMFLFQHRNYEVASVRRNSKVIRRYSDFVWLLDCLHKRYPFRQLPLLPPKRVQINGNHIAADSSFIEKRRRGLARFANALVRHPVLREEQLVVMFLTVPTVDACLLSRPRSHTMLTSATGARSLAQASHHFRSRGVRRQEPATQPRRQSAAESAGYIRYRALWRPTVGGSLHQSVQLD